MDLQQAHQEIGAYLFSKLDGIETQETANGVCRSLEEEFSGLVSSIAVDLGPPLKVSASIPPENLKSLLTKVREKKMEVTA